MNSQLKDTAAAIHAALIVSFILLVLPYLGIAVAALAHSLIAGR